MTGLIKTLLALILLFFVWLFVTTTFAPTPAAEYAEARKYFTDTEIATGRQFTFERRFFMWDSIALELGLLLVLVFTGAGRRLADVFGRWTGYRSDAPAPADDASRWRRCRAWTGNLLRWLAVVLLMGATYALVHEMLQFPVNLGRYYQSRAWGMTSQPIDDWFSQHWLAVGVGLAAEGIAGVGLFLLLRWFPRTWFLLGAFGAMLLAFASAWLLPVVVAPLFNQFTPIAQTKWAPLEPRLRELASEAGISIDKIYVADASRQGNHTNAYFTGLGDTQSIVLYDTLLKNHPPDEIVSILAHEIGHWKHQHIIQGILLGTLAGFVGLVILDRLLRWFLARPPLYLKSISDPAAVPLVLLLGYLGTWVAMPLENAVSRHFERQADETSLQLAGMPDVFIKAEQRLAIDNKSNLVPAPWNVWLFNTHPSVLQRIEMARQWEATHGEKRE